MIRQLLLILDPHSRQILQRMIVWQCVNAIAQGILFALTVPVLRALLGPHPDTVWPWVWVLAGASVLYAVVHWLSLRSRFSKASPAAKAGSSCSEKQEAPFRAGARPRRLWISAF